MKHKYAKTLEYANGEKVEPAELKKFIKANGGLNECVTQMAKLEKAKDIRSADFGAECAGSVISGPTPA